MENDQYSITILVSKLYMKIHVPSMLAKDVEMINKQTQQTSL